MKPCADKSRGRWSFELMHDTDLHWLCRYAVVQSHHGRPLQEILSDRAVVERCSADTPRRLLDQPDVTEAVSKDTLERLHRITDPPLQQRSAPGG